MKVLIIDDDSATTEMIALILKQTGAETRLAHSGTEGIQKAKTENPDLIILDYMMPVMDGLQTCIAIRQFTQTPILMISAVNNPSLVADLLNAGADDYMIKPVGATSLLARAQILTRRTVFLPIVATA